MLNYIRQVIFIGKQQADDGGFNRVDIAFGFVRYAVIKFSGIIRSCHLGSVLTRVLQGFFVHSAVAHRCIEITCLSATRKNHCFQ